MTTIIESPKDPSAWVKEMNIYQKMAAVTSEIGVIAKNLSIEINKSRSYKAVSERDVIDEVKPLLAKYRIYCYPCERELVEKDILVTTTNYGDRQNLYFHYRNVMRFVNIDKPDEFVDVPTYSTGIDAGDKADGKAMTYGDKYALLKAFMISTGDDPDQEKSQEISTDYITKKQYDELSSKFSKEDIKEWMQELGISNGRMIPKAEYEKKLKASLESAKKSLPDKDFY